MRRKDSFFNKKFVLIGLFILLIGGVSIGFAALSSKLTINGKATIADVNWNIHFENAKVTEGSANGTAAANIIDASDKTKASWEVTFTKPGDYYEFTIDVVNAGTLDAKLSGITAENLTTAEDVYANYTITPVAVDGQNPTTAVNDVLRAGERYSITFRIEFDPNIEAKDLPEGEQTIELSYELNYVQA